MGRQNMKGAMGVLAAVLLVACGGGGGEGPAADAGADVLLDEAGNPVGPNDIVIAGGPPIDLPGTALWLDGNFGLARAGEQVRAWTDRSGHAHVFERAAAADPGVTAGRLGDHGALHFDGQARLVLSPASDGEGRAALTIAEQDFLLALVVQDEGSQQPAALLALSPWDEANPPAPGAGPAWLLELAEGLRFSLVGAAGDTDRLEGPAPRAGQAHVVLVTAQGPTTTVRLDGDTVATHPNGRLRGQQAGGARLALPFLPVHVGGLGAGQAGLTGLIAEVVLVIGPGVETAVAPLELYLRDKYGL